MIFLVAAVSSTTMKRRDLFEKLLLKLLFLLLISRTLLSSLRLSSPSLSFSSILKSAVNIPPSYRFVRSFLRRSAEDPTATCIPLGANGDPDEAVVIITAVRTAGMGPLGTGGAWTEEGNGKVVEE
jgi:hypothetical protein